MNICMYLKLAVPPRTCMRCRRSSSLALLPAPASFSSSTSCVLHACTRSWVSPSEAGAAASLLAVDLASCSQASKSQAGRAAWITTAASPRLGGLLQGRQTGQLHWSSANRDFPDNKVSISMFEDSREARLIIGKLSDAHSLFFHDFTCTISGKIRDLYSRRDPYMVN